MIIISIINCQVQRDQRANLKQCRVASFSGVYSDITKNITPLARFQTTSASSINFTAVFNHHFSTGFPWPWTQAFNLGWRRYWALLQVAENLGIIFRQEKNQNISHLFNNVHTIHDLTKDNMSPVQPFSFNWEQMLWVLFWEKTSAHTCANEKLAAICVRSSVGHGKNTGTLHECKRSQ